MKLAYVMSRFPKITETFILREMVELKRRGISLDIYPLIRQKESVRHPDVRRLIPAVHYTSFLSLAVLAANLRMFLEDPARYLGTLWEVFAGTFGSWGLFFKTLFLFPESVCIAHKMREQGIKHVHAHFATFPAATALIVRRLTGIPYSFTAHGSDIHVDQRMLGAKIRASAFAVMISEYNRRFVLDKCGGDLDEKMVVIHCGVRMEDHEMPSLPASPPEDPFTILCVASLNEVKGHRYLVEAARHLKERGEDFLCRLVGDGPLRDRLAGQISEAGLEKKFVLHGALPRGEVARRMRRADAAVLPSVMTSRGDREGIPVALMEAMATGLPAVASDISGIPELVEDGRTGLLVPPRESRALADALHRLMEDPELRRKFGQRGREKVREQFTITGSVERLLELWGGASAG